MLTIETERDIARSASTLLDRGGSALVERQTYPHVCDVPRLTCAHLVPVSTSTNDRAG